MANTGYLGWSDLEQYDTFNGVATGVVKPNVPTDPDYVPPVYDPVTCTEQEESLLFDIVNVSSFSFDFDSGITPVIVEAKQGSTVLASIGPSSSVSKTLTIPASVGNIKINIKAAQGSFADVTRIVATNGAVIGAYLNDFTGLDYVDLRSCSISAISVSGLSLLKELYVQDNLISSISLSGLSSLEIINISSNSLNYLDISACPLLHYINAESNTLSSLSMTNNPDITVCILNNNSIGSINVSSNTLLENLQVGSNNIASIDISNNTALKTFIAYGNNLTAINISSNTALEHLDLFGNQLTSINLSVNTNLNSLYLASNDLSLIDLTNNIALAVVTVGDNADITGFDVSSLSLLEYLDCQNLPLVNSLDISGNNSLKDLRCGGSGFTSGTAPSADIDAIIIKMNSNIVSGGSLHYDAIPAGSGVQPSSASLSAYNSLVSKGCDLRGNIPS